MHENAKLFAAKKKPAVRKGDFPVPAGPKALVTRCIVSACLLFSSGIFPRRVLSIYREFESKLKKPIAQNSERMSRVRICEPLCN